MGSFSAVFDNDDMRNITKEFSRLGDRCYLENIGTSLYPQCLIETIHKDLIENVYMNPHTDKYTKDCIDQVRNTVLNHFNSDPSEYTVVFTSGATQALRLVAESFQFSNHEVMNCGSFVYVKDNHTSALGLREIAKSKNADIIPVGHEDFLKALQSQRVVSSLEKYKNEGNTLLVYPAQSNFNGFKYPIDSIGQLKRGCLNSYIERNFFKVNCNWYVLLDSASYVSSNKLDLSQVQPDFFCLSFYKIFGFPTGLGALIMKNSAVDVLTDKKYFGGGTVDVVLSGEDYHVKRNEIHERFEDGTIAFLSILALKHSFHTLNSMIPKVINDNVMETISYHTFLLAKDLYDQLRELRHQNKAKAAVLYMDTDFSNIKAQGAIVTFNLLRDDGTYIGYAEFQHMANLFNINIRTGCFCNSGACQRHLGVTNEEIKDSFKAGHKCGDELDLINGKPTGAVRVSFAYYNTFQDVDKLLLMIYRCFIKKPYVAPKRKGHKLSMAKPDTPIMEKKRSLSNILPNRLKIVDDIKSGIIRNGKSSKGFVSEVAIYPVKSCGAFKLRHAWLLGPKGFRYDREWMIVKENGVCLTQKQVPTMCLIRPVIDLKLDVMILNCKGLPQITVPLDVSQHVDYNVPICQSRVCTDTVKAYDCGDEVASWVSQALGISYLRLIRQSDADSRTKKKGDGEMLSLSNQAQFLLVNKATVKWLEDRINDSSFTGKTQQLTDRFRANIVVDMDQELVEREWQRVVIGKHEFKVDGPCNRCQMVCIDQDTGDKTVEPLRTISEQFNGKLRFGIYLSYVGAVDGSNDIILKTGARVEPMVTDVDIIR